MGSEMESQRIVRMALMTTVTLVALLLSPQIAYSQTATSKLYGKWRCAGAQNVARPRVLVGAGGRASAADVAASIVPNKVSAILFQRDGRFQVWRKRGIRRGAAGQLVEMVIPTNEGTWSVVSEEGESNLVVQIVWQEETRNARLGFEHGELRLEGLIDSYRLEFVRPTRYP